MIVCVYVGLCVCVGGCKRESENLGSTPHRHTSVPVSSPEAAASVYVVILRLPVSLN